MIDRQALRALLGGGRLEDMKRSLVEACEMATKSLTLDDILRTLKRLGEDPPRPEIESQTAVVDKLLRDTGITLICVYAASKECNPAETADPGPVG